MKYIGILAFLLIFTNCEAQETKLLLRQKLISDLSETPIYPRLTEDINGQIEWKENFKYLDSIDIYSITYLSDGLKINGLLAKPKKAGVRQNSDLLNSGKKRTIMIDKTTLQEKINELQATLDNQDTAYDYEKAFDKKWNEIGHEVFQQSLGQLSIDGNKKKR